MGADHWDYTAAAPFYDGRPEYADDALDACLARARIEPGARVCDVGAGTGILARQLRRRGLRVVALEPNSAMRDRGRRRPDLTGTPWVAGLGEALPLVGGTCALVTFGSSFNVVDRAGALAEAARVLAPGGSVLCVWNHRELDDPLQARLEAIIRARLPAYEHGVRRDDQRAIITASGLFRDVVRLERPFTHDADAATWADAWHAHVTLRRQAGPHFAAIVAAIRHEVAGLGTGTVRVPYVTRAWLAERR